VVVARARFRFGLFLVLTAMPAWALVLGACGARTGLGVPVPRDGAPPIVRRDAGPDVVEEPPIEFPPLDASKHDAYKADCPAQTFVYVVATDDSLLRFDPPSASFATIGKLACPANGTHPFSMAVDRKGVAYVEYENGMLFAVNTADASCQTTPYVPNQLPPFGNFGMGYVTIGAGPEEQLFLAADSPGTLGVLGAPKDFAVSPVGVILPDMKYAELTGTGDGRLYAYYAWGANNGSYIAELDKTTAQVLGQDSLPDVDRGIGWAFAFWGGDFWLFTTPGPEPQTTVKYDPLTKEATVVAHYTSSIVGAGVSTCAPN
jgi:hypothetical protein